MRLIALDWQLDRCQILVGNATKGKVAVERALDWNEIEPTTPAQAEDLGRKLKEMLKSAGVQPAPAIVCVGRERLLLKEIRHPVVPKSEEPGLVRFQAAKDMVETLEEVVLDYAPLPPSRGEARSLVAVLRRDLFNVHAVLCRAAGLKLQALTPRAFVMSECLPRDLAAQQTVATLWLGTARGELTILRGGGVSFARNVETGDILVSELRRSLAIFTSQGHDRVEALFVVGAAAGELVESLHAALRIPVIRTPPPAGDAPAVAHAALEKSGQLPIDFAHPKEPAAAAPVESRRWVLAAGVGVLVLLGLAFFGVMTLSAQQAQITELAEEAETLEREKKAFAPDIAELEYLKDWERSAVPWLDEFRDLTARFPDEVGFRWTKIQAEPIPRKSDKEKYVSRLQLNGVTPAGKDAAVHQYLDSLRDEHLLARIERFKGGSSQEFHFKIDVAPREEKKPAVRPQVAGGTK